MSSTLAEIRSFDDLVGVEHVQVDGGGNERDEIRKKRKMAAPERVRISVGTVITTVLGGGDIGSDSESVGH
ncbi:hypothetical protein Tco_0715545 [Tanacetum coccineum]